VTNAAPLAALLASSACLYIVVSRSGRAWRGVVAAAIFASTPLIWRQYQGAPSTLYVLPVIAAWLAAVAYFQATGSPVALPAAGALLGVGVYTSASAAVMMTVYLLLSVAAVPALRRPPFTALALFVGAFAATAAPFALAMILHPDRFRDIVNTAHLYDANRFNVLQGIREMTSWLGLTARSEVYWDYFNPAFLFLSPAVLLWPLAVLLPLGLYHVVDGEMTPVARLVLGGFLAAPFVASLSAAAPVPSRILWMTPFAAILAAYGLQRLLSIGRASFDQLVTWSSGH
jgi:hypothetical protein